MIFTAQRNYFQQCPPCAAYEKARKIRKEKDLAVMNNNLKKPSVK